MACRVKCRSQSPPLFTDLHFTTYESALMLRTIDALFPEEQQIPPQYRITRQLKQDCYLIDGELRRWEGPLQEVHSPVRIRSAAGSAQQRIGEAPLLTGGAALEILAVAVRA